MRMPVTVTLTLFFFSLTASAFAFTCDPAYHFPFAKKVNGKSIGFEYSGPRGPEHWAELAPNNKWLMCASGERQAPIAISKTAAVPAHVQVEFHYDQDIHFVDHSDVLGANHGAGNYIVIDGVRYNLLQIHFHRPAEFILNGTTYPLEAHLVHQSAAGALAVIGVFIVKGSADPGVIKLPQDPKAEAEPTLIKPQALLPAQRSFFRFNGSLTTPGCDQPLLFNEMEHPIEMSAEQIDAFACGIENSARPLQKMNSRFILYGE